jgi:S1-C subfamily serine protease
MIRALVALICAGVLAAGEPALDALTRAYVFVGNGSGVAISPTEVLTNHHVIDDLHPYSAVLSDGREVTCTLIGTDPVGDLALLRLPTGVTAPGVVTLADADAIRVGAPVWAMGNPFGLGDLDGVPTLSRGIMSTVRVARGVYADCIVHDAPVNPGNSGGPLIVADGRLLGINGQIRSRSGFRVNSGIGLAISAPQIAAFLPHLRAADGGYVHHADAPDGLKIEDRGAGPEVVAAVAPLMAGDVVLTVDGRVAPAAETVRSLLTAAPWTSGATAQVRVRRGETVVEVALALRRHPIPGTPWHGLVLEDRPDGVGKRLAIVRVEAGSPAARAGIAAPATLVSVDTQPVANRIAWLRALRGKEVGDVLALIVRGADGAERPVALRLVPK